MSFIYFRADSWQSVRAHPFTGSLQYEKVNGWAALLFLNCSGVCSLHRNTPQLWTCGQWAAYLASFSPRNHFSLENLKLTK